MPSASSTRKSRPPETDTFAPLPTETSTPVARMSSSVAFFSITKLPVSETEAAGIESVTVVPERRVTPAWTTVASTCLNVASPPMNAVNTA